MKTLKGNEDFLRINQKVNIFDIVSCKEEQASQIIAWLLNPREAHGFGNRFFEAMLNELKDKNIKIFKGTREVKNENKQKESLIKDWLKKYSNIIIQKEYCINSKCKNENGRIDILLCLEDEDVKTLFVIENKYGAKEHNKQTQIYYEYFSSKYKNYNICYIYLDINKYYEDGEKKLTDSEHWNIINYDWIVDFLKENLTGSYVDKILQDIYLEFTENYDEEPYFNKFFNQKTKLYKDYKNDISLYKNPFPYHPGSDEEKFQFALYDDFYSVLSECSNWDNLINMFENNGYLADNHGDNCIDITLKNVDDKYLELKKDVNNQKKWWPFYVDITHHKPKDDEKGKAYLEIKLMCTNEYIDDDNKMGSVQDKLKTIFKDKKIQNKIEQKIVPFKSGEKIKKFFLQKVIIKDFDFSENKLNKLCETVDRDFTDKINKMYEIFFPKKDN